MTYPQVVYNTVDKNLAIFSKYVETTDMVWKCKKKLIQISFNLGVDGGCKAVDNVNNLWKTPFIRP